MKLQLIVKTGAHQGLTFSADHAGTYQIGRAAGVDVLLCDDSYVSRKHCTINLTPDGAWIQDMDSRGGTFVNGKRVEEVPISDGDTIVVGRTALQVSLSGVEPLTATVEPPVGVSGFHLVKELPSDGPGEVWWAYSEQAERMVILHFLCMDDPVAEDRKRFLRESGICSRIDHPSLVRFLEQGITGNMFWFATELAEGENLGQFVEKHGPLTMEDALSVVDQVLNAVDYLHQKGVIHRSLRPESLLVTRQSGALVVRLADLGDAKCFQELQCVTKLGKRGYSIHAFTAPESLTDFQRLDPRSDVYALGAIFYFILTGHPPFVAASEEEIATKILTEKPLPPDVLKPSVPKAIVDVVEQAMVRDADARYSTAPEMRNALRQAIGMVTTDGVPRKEHLSPPAKSKVFFSYSHKDEELRDELEKHLSILKRQGVIAGWHDRKIGVGREWADEIDKHLNTADVILLLISADFMASDYCYDIEMKRALERHEAGEARVIPVILRPVDWRGAPFGKLQALPTDAQPVTKWSNRDEAFKNVAQGIRVAVKEL